MEEELDLPTHLLTEHRKAFGRDADEVAEYLAEESPAELARRHRLLHLVKPTCSHCGTRPTRRRNGLCDACNVYQATYGQLPSEEVLVRRSQRAENRNHHRG